MRNIHCSYITLNDFSYIMITKGKSLIIDCECLISSLSECLCLFHSMFMTAFPPILWYAEFFDSFIFDLSTAVKCVLKLVSTIFYQIFIFHQMIALPKLWKMFFHLKSSFWSWDIQIFVYSSSPLFFRVSHCFRGWFKKNIKVCDIITCLNKDLIAYFVW